jgi:cold-inducible RNA-binding protein
VKNIFVGNLSFQTTELDIRSLFESYGTVDRISVVTDRDTGKPKGFGFVEMANDGEGDKAIAALNGQELDGRALTINESRPKSESGGGKDRGYSGGGGGGRGNSGGNGRGRY